MNAKEELEQELKEVGGSFQGAVIVRYGKKIFEEHQLEEFLHYMNFEYDEGYGEVSFRGFVLLDNGSWLERDSYDGMEWWSLKKRPSLTDEV